MGTGCGSEPPRGLLDGSWPTGHCSKGQTNGQFTCTPDPGSKPVDCDAEEADLEFITLGDFSKDTAADFYVYVDRSGEGRVSSFSTGWSAPTHDDPSPLCGKSKALHIQGGIFWGWGGGFGSSAKDWAKSASNHDPAFDCTRYPDSPVCDSKDVPDYMQSAVFNLSSYEGVAVWARRGPDSQPGFRVNVGDQYTDDDISYLTYAADPTLPRHCERIRECGCLNHKPCQLWETAPYDTPQMSFMANANPRISKQDAWTCATPGTYCEDPASGLIPGYFNTGGPLVRCNTCEQTRCDEPYEAYPDGALTGGEGNMDPQFFGKPCTPHTFRSGITASLCHDPATDPPPAEADQQCGDHWVRAVYLTSDWNLYLVPFTSMLQQGFAKKQGKMDLAHISVVRLTWDGGYVDFWVSKIAFYRHKGYMP
jgi:hypothetical protein